MKIFQDRASASIEAAALIVEQLTNKLSLQERTSLMVSGGNTPRQCFEALSNAQIPWARVDISLSDERDVPSDHPASNERLLRETLLVNFAQESIFTPLLPQTDKPLQPFACVLIGMGEDGHFASLFPDSPELDEGLTSSAGAISVSTPSSDYSRISATLNTITESDLIVLLIFGEAKRKIAESPDGYPIQKLLAQTRTPVQIFWAP